MPVWHVHPHWELYFCADTIEQINFVNGQTTVYTQPLAILTSPFSQHGTAVSQQVKPYDRDIVYFGDEFLARIPKEYFSLALFSQSAACFFPSHSPMQPLCASSPHR